MTQAPRKVVIVGRDAPAFIAALSLQRALGAAGPTISLVELPSLLTAVDVYTAVPSIHGLHRLIGLDEAAVLTAARAVPMAAQRYSDWSPGKSHLQPYDSPEPPGSSLSFAQLWSKGRISGLPVAFEEFSFGAMAARLGRVPSESDDPRLLGAAYGYHLDATAYSMLLRALAERRGIEVRKGYLDSVEADGTQIRAIHLADGERAEGDLFIDATGAEAALISTLPGDDFQSWKSYLPCDRKLSASVEALDPIPAFSQVSAFDGGWVGMFPLQDRMAITAAFRSSEVELDDLADRVGRVVGLPLTGEGVVAPLSPGIRESPWIGNCVAIGEAAVALDPLDAVTLHMAHVCVTHLITFFPVDSNCAIEAAEYGKAVAMHGANLRDFQQTHYKLNGRAGQTLWDEARAATPSVGLARKLRAFEARGEVVLYDEEAFDARNWASLFLGHQLYPRDYDPRVDLIEEQDHIQRIQSRLREIAAKVPTLPTVATFLSATQIQVKPPAPAQ